MARSAPLTFADFVRILQKPGGAFYTGYGHKFYARNAAGELDEAKIRDFADRCPPFLMMVLAAVMAQYKRAIVETLKQKTRWASGPTDVRLSAILPCFRYQ
jgi:hypothetical protein